MPGQWCVVCRNTQTSNPTACFHWIPKESVSRVYWMSAFNLYEENTNPSMRVCCRYFPDGDPQKKEDLTLGMECMDCIFVPYVRIHGTAQFKLDIYTSVRLVSLGNFWVTYEFYTNA